MNRPVLNRKLVLETPQHIPDGAGGQTVTWVALGEVWASIKATSGRVRGREAVSAARVPWKITLRAAPLGSPSRPRPEQRFRAGGRVFAISAVAEADPDGRYLTCFATEEVAS